MLGFIFYTDMHMKRHRLRAPLCFLLAASEVQFEAAAAAARKALNRTQKLLATAIETVGDSPCGEVVRSSVRVVLGHVGEQRGGRETAGF